MWMVVYDVCVILVKQVSQALRVKPTLTHTHTVHVGLVSSSAGTVPNHTHTHTLQQA